MSRLALIVAAVFVVSGVLARHPGLPVQQEENVAVEEISSFEAVGNKPQKAIPTPCEILQFALFIMLAVLMFLALGAHWATRTINLGHGVVHLAKEKRNLVSQNI